LIASSAVEAQGCDAGERTLLEMNPAGDALPRGAWIGPDEVAARAAAAGLDVDGLMTALLPWAASFAQVPISGFRVGAVALGRSGALYAGANLELAGAPLSGSVHAEQAVVTNAWLRSEARLTALALTAPPCGHCRQFLNELSDAPALRVLVEKRPPTTLGALLPASFGPADLGVAGGLFETAGHGLRLDGRGDRLEQEALAAANASYAPYTRAFAGVTLATKSGTVVSGRYAESAAFNPSLPALQSALVALALRRESTASVSQIVLVEADGLSSQRSVAEATWAVIGGVSMRYRRAIA
jgi:cytidine deaminase